MRKRRFCCRTVSVCLSVTFVCCIQTAEDNVKLLSRTGSRIILVCLNIRSLNNKLDDVIEISRDHRIDVLFLVETWHDPDDVSICRLRSVVFTSSTSLVRAPSPTLFTGARTELLDIGATPSTFEFACVRVSSGAASYIVCAVYRPGSATVSATFFVDLADVLDCLATFVELTEVLFVVGDLNVHLERPADAPSVQLVDLLTDCNLSCRVTAPTHDLGGLLDIVASRDDLPPPSVKGVDIDLSDGQF